MHGGCYTIWPLSFFGSTTVAAPDVIHLHVVLCILHGDRSPNDCNIVLVNNQNSGFETPRILSDFDLPSCVGL